MTQKEKEFILFEFDPKYNEEIKWLFERRNIDGLFPVFFIMYSFKHNYPIALDETSMTGYEPGVDPLQDRLYDASLMTFGGNKELFSKLRGLQRLIGSIDRNLFDEAYTYLLDDTLCKTDLVAGTQMQPNGRIATTIANILREHDCKTVFGAYSGIGIFALACDGMKYTGAEPYAPANLIAEVLCDAFGVQNATFLNVHPVDDWTRKKFDAVIGNLPVDADFFNIYRADHFLYRFNKDQDAFINSLIERKTARKTAAFLVHFEFANYYEYDKTRKLICDQGMLETVIALPEDIFRDALVPTYLVILDMEGGHNEAEFMDASASIERQCAWGYRYMENRFDLRECVKDTERVTVSYDTIARASWSFNPAVYLQNAVCREGQEQVRLGDLVSFSCGEMVEGERFIPYEALSDSFSRAVAGITPSAVTKGRKQMVVGPSVILGLTRGSRRETQKIMCGICSDYGTYSVENFLSVLQPDPEKILPDYLALVLMSDPSFARYFKSIQEYYVDDVRSSHLLERRIPVHKDLADQKKAVIDALGRADMAEISYNIIVAGAGKSLGWYRNALSKHGCTLISSVETVEGPDGLANVLSDLTRENTPVSRRADAVVFLSDIPLDGKNPGEKFEGLDAVLDLRLIYERKGIKFFASSKSGLDEIRKSGIISSRRLKPVEEGHFFMTGEDGRPSEGLVASLREELDRSQSPESRIRSRHRAALEAADWLDEAFASMEIRAAETLSEFLMAAEEGVDTTRNLSDLRNVAHRIIEILKNCRAVPPIDNGAIPHLLYDKRYENKKDGKTYIQDISIMRRSLVSSLISLIDIGNEGTHTFKASSNLGSAMLQTLLEFVTWMYEKRDEFSRPLPNYWHVDSDYERTWEETSAPAELHMIAGRPHWTCGDVHLFVPPTIVLHDGDMVTVRARSEDNGKVKIPGVKYFAYPRGYDNRNPNGYTVDATGGDSSEVEKE